MSPATDLGVPLRIRTGITLYPAGFAVIWAVASFTFSLMFGSPWYWWWPLYGLFPVPFLLWVASRSQVLVERAGIRVIRLRGDEDFYSWAEIEKIIVPAMGPYMASTRLVLRRGESVALSAWAGGHTKSMDPVFGQRKRDEVETCRAAAALAGHDIHVVFDIERD